MGQPKLVIGGINLSTYMAVQHEDGLDPVGADFYAPQYVGSPALSEGRRGLPATADNREHNYPLILEGSSRANLHKLITEIDNAIVRGATLEFASDDADPSSFFQVEGGKLAVTYQYFLTGVALTTRATLQVSTRPYAHTGTQRLVASLPMGSSAVMQFPASGIRGDAYAFANLEVRVGSQVASSGRVIAWGVHPHPSHLAYRPAPSGVAQASSVVVGASGAIASQYLGIPISPTGASGISFRQFLDPPDAHVGRHRVIAFGRSGLQTSIAMYGVDRFGALLGATALATQTDQSKLQMIDLGEINVAPRASGQEPVPTQYVDIYAGGSGAINASPAFQLNGILFLPLDYSAGIMRTRGAGGNSALYSDSFARFNYGGLAGYLSLSALPAAETGGVNWSYIRGGISVGMAPINPWYAVNAQALFPCDWTSPGGAKANSSGLYALASGVLNGDVMGELRTGLWGGASGDAASAAITFFPKAQSNASTIIGGVGARLQLGPSQTLQIVSASANGATAVLASAGIASTLASGLYLGQAHTLAMRISGARMDVWLATGAFPASPILSASHANALQTGWPVLAMNSGGAVATGTIWADDVRLSSVAGGASDITQREWFRFESFPEERVVQGNASVFAAYRDGDHRGAGPKLPPVGSGAGATGPARVVVFAGAPDQVFGNDGADVTLRSIERFRFLV